MDVYRIENFKEGWILGDFEPSVLRIKEFELGVKVHNKGDVWPAHIHKLCDEYNILIKGWMRIQDKFLISGDVFVIKKGELADPVFLDDCTVVTLKAPSIPGDKYEVSSY